MSSNIYNCFDRQQQLEIRSEQLQKEHQQINQSFENLINTTKIQLCWTTIFLMIESENKQLIPFHIFIRARMDNTL